MSAQKSITKTPAISEDIARRIYKLVVAARQGQAVCDMMMLESTIKNSELDTIQHAVWGVSDTLERIGDELERIWSE